MSNNALGMTALRDFDADLADMLLQGRVTEVLLWQLSLFVVRSFFVHHKKSVALRMVVNCSFW